LRQVDISRVQDHGPVFDGLELLEGDIGVATVRDYLD
jgi:hypothetical protein